MTATRDHEPAPENGGGLVRLRLDLGYDGSRFHGWARPPGLPSVQEAVEDALTTVLRLPGPARTVVAGRTDAGVHATGQVIHVDVPAEVLGTDPEPVVRALPRRVNGLLPTAVRVHAADLAPEGFDARFAAIGRRYRYHVVTGAVGPHPLARTWVLHEPQPLDLPAMNAGCAHLIGEHDFLSYCRPRAGTSTVRGVTQCEWSAAQAPAVVAPPGSELLVLTIAADAFCHSLVRSVVGAGLLVGRGRRSPEWMGEVLREPSRAAGVPVAPAVGLVLAEVTYPPPARLVARVAEARAVRGPVHEGSPRARGDL